MNAWWHRGMYLLPSPIAEDGTGSRFKHLVASVFHIRCKSHIYGFLHQSLSCRLYRWHTERHFDPEVNYRWSYGDDYYTDLRNASPTCSASVKEASGGHSTAGK